MSTKMVLHLDRGGWKALTGQNVQRLPMLALLTRQCYNSLVPVVYNTRNQGHGMLFCLGEYTLDITRWDRATSNLALGQCEVRIRRGLDGMLCDGG